MSLYFVKIGSSSITRPSGGIDQRQVHRILQDCKALQSKCHQIIIVTSGAIQSARAYSLFEKEDLSTLQALSAFGQPEFMHGFTKGAKNFDLKVAQILLTHEDLKHKTRFLNAKMTINKLLQKNIIPILNENDVVSFDEITQGDNDQLAAMVAVMMNASQLIMLTGHDGIRVEINGRNIIQRFIDFDDRLPYLSKLKKSNAGKGGMTTKLMAVRKCPPAGINVLVLQEKRRRSFAC